MLSWKGMSPYGRRTEMNTPHSLYVVPLLLAGLIAAWLLGGRFLLPAGAAPPAKAPAQGTPTLTPCPISFSDVHTTDYFYQPVLYLACDGAISGYADGTFRPY